MEGVSRKQSPYRNPKLATPVPGAVASRRSVEVSRGVGLRGIRGGAFFGVPHISKNYCQPSAAAISEFHNYDSYFVQLLS